MFIDVLPFSFGLGYHAMEVTADSGEFLLCSWERFGLSLNVLQGRLEGSFSKVPKPWHDCPTLGESVDGLCKEGPVLEQFICKGWTVEFVQACLVARHWHLCPREICGA